MIDNLFDLPDGDIEAVAPGMEMASCLVVPPRAKSPEENGGVDELAQWEAEFRRSETMPVYFTDGNGETDGAETMEDTPAYTRFMGLPPDARPTLASAMDFRDRWRAGEIIGMEPSAPASGLPVARSAPPGGPSRGRARSPGDPRPGDPMGWKVV
jgi:hypothetical protein